MKKIIISLSVLLLAASCSKQPVSTNPNPPVQNPPATSTPSQGITLNSYTSPTALGFSIQYGSDFGFSTDTSQVGSLAYIPVCDENMAACAFLARSVYPGTNFDGAGVSINIDKAMNTEAKCYNFNVPTNAAQTPVADVVINNIAFKSATGGDAGAGHSEQVQVYRNFHNGRCYEISEHLGSTNIGNYEPGTIKEFNKDEVLAKLQNVVNSFKFTNNNQASGAPSTQITLSGTTVCLPHKNTQPGQPQTLECAIGIKEEKTGKFYGLKDSVPPMYDVNKRIEVTGTLVDAPQSNYDVVGDIDGAQITLLDK